MGGGGVFEEMRHCGTASCQWTNLQNLTLADKTLQRPLVQQNRIMTIRLKNQNKKNNHLLNTRKHVGQSVLSKLQNYVLYKVIIQLCLTFNVNDVSQSCYIYRSDVKTNCYSGY